MIDHRFIGHELPRFAVDVEAGRLSFFAKATGQTDPVYRDLEAAWQAGYPAIPVPPTFFFCLEMGSPNPNVMRELLSIDIGRVLHGEQQFVYHRMAYAGDRLSFAARIEDIYDKKNGALEFVVKAVHITNQRGEPVAELRNTTVVRNG
ncbi:MaoC family dehydratase N-terminal domain-containing protein [Roseateles sp.]|uniref:MaoC family dehydratase N-terminal domain-containing protein n=1 Tax=Roseateles sp. TaxID=1971397 RepID=UPI00286D164B|nr:MaoC family dehydratase N-terminal domain-containing protein [Roseateles sp.]